jgi:hypothetical protein
MGSIDELIWLGTPGSSFATHPSPSERQWGLRLKKAREIDATQNPARDR